MNDQTIEHEIQDKGLTAPQVVHRRAASVNANCKPILATN